MKQPADTLTIELPLPGAKRKPGRPATGSAMTNAERQKAFRDRQRANGAPRAARTAHEAKFEMDYTRPTWEEMEKVQDALVEMQNKLEAANKTISHLEKENALMIQERANAFKAADQAKADLERVKHATTNNGKLASEVLRLENVLHQVNADNRRLEVDAENLEKKVYEYQALIDDLQAKLNKRNASRKSPKAD
ncbi:hypothetical protein GJ697_01455 [Pseudoduganella sp. FT25W]|uniref:Uncharacterized protein n=1 Tax=Duganella alba TaxID=2666081 RepID=A0A6L5QAE1_9BURK|nr:hypothetical protein [Duganella alba]MRX06498.1 hypothetical protein [Duganella alba]MRX14892.1 hypothetical protein [Duganella alba]